MRTGTAVLFAALLMALTCPALRAQGGRAGTLRPAWQAGLLAESPLIATNQGVVSYVSALGSVAFLGNRQVAVAFPIRVVPSGRPTLTLRGSAEAEKPFAVHLMVFDAATGKLSRVVDLPSSRYWPSGIVSAQSDGIDLLTGSQVQRLGPDLVLQQSTPLPAPLPDAVAPGTWLPLRAVTGDMLFFRSVNPEPTLENGRLADSTWLELDARTLTTIQMWKAGQDFYPVAASRARILVSVGGNAYLKDMATGAQVKIPELAEDARFAPNGGLVLNGDSEFSPWSIEVETGGKSALLHAGLNCLCEGRLAAASAVPRVIDLVEPLHEHDKLSMNPGSATTFSRSVQSVAVVDLGAPPTEQILKVAKGINTGDPGPVALSPDGRRLALVSGDTLMLFDLPPVGGGARVKLRSESGTAKMSSGLSGPPRTAETDADLAQFASDSDLGPRPAVPAGVAANPGAPSDGHWWMAATPAQRAAFNLGWSECHGWLLHHPLPARDRFDVERAVTGVYASGRMPLTTPVAAVMERLLTAQKNAASAPPRADDNYALGQAWLLDPDDAYFRVSLVRGFLACQQSETGANIIASPAELKTRVNGWYGIDDAHLAGDRHLSDPLSQVLPRVERQAP